MPVRLAGLPSTRRCAITLAAAALALATGGCVRGSARLAPPATGLAVRAASPQNTITASAMTSTSSSAGRLSRAALLRSAPSGTYIVDVLSVQGFEVVRWPEAEHTPLRVWIGDGSQLAGWRPTFPAMVRSAFTEWAAQGIPIRVVFVKDSARAQIRVNWVDHFGHDVSGRTTWQYDDGGRIRAGRTTLSTRRSDGLARSDVQVRAIALHEVGHALGLQHVQDDNTSIMSPRVDVVELSNADRATVRLLYSLPTGRLE
jgi:hypothetical protein